MGQYIKPENASVGNYYSNIIITSVLETVDATKNDGCQWAYSLKDGTNARFGNIFATWTYLNGNVIYNDFSTDDIGSTSAITFSVEMSGNYAELIANVSGGNWAINLKRLTGGVATGHTFTFAESVIVKDLIVTGNTTLGSVSASTIFSAGTNLYDIFLTAQDGNDITRIQPGFNTYTAGTANNPSINISAATLSYLSAETVSANTIFSAGTNLYDIFLTALDGNDITRVQPGLNIYTAGTENNPSINISAATLNYLSASTISADTIYVHSISGMSPVNINNVIISDGGLTANTMSSTTYYGDGSQITNINLSNTFAPA